MDSLISQGNNLAKCPICIELLTDDIIVSNLDICGHSMCELCFKKMLEYSDKCPVCTRQFSKCQFSLKQEKIAEYVLTEGDLKKITHNKNDLQGII